MFTQKMKFKSTGTIYINGKEFKGSSVEYNGQSIIIDGVKHSTSSANNGPATIKLIGDCEYIHSASGSVYVEGNALTVSTVSGRADINGDVGGNVSTVSGRIEAKSIQGSASSVSGNIRTR